MKHIDHIEKAGLINDCVQEGSEELENNRILMCATRSVLQAHSTWKVKLFSPRSTNSAPTQSSFLSIPPENFPAWINILLPF